MSQPDYFTRTQQFSRATFPIRASVEIVVTLQEYHEGPKVTGLRFTWVVNFQGRCVRASGALHRTAPEAMKAARAAAREFSALVFSVPK